MTSATQVWRMSNKVLQETIQELFTEFVKPCNVLHRFRNILSKTECENIQSVVTQKGEIDGASFFLNLLTRKDDWFSILLNVLRHREVKLQHIANIMEKEKRLQEFPLSSVYVGQEGDYSRESPSVTPTASMYITYNNNLKENIHELFVNKVMPGDVVSVFHKYNYKVLTKKDIGNVCAKLNSCDPQTVAELLLERLILYESWFDVLLQVLRNPEIKLDHIADAIERATVITRQSYFEELHGTSNKEVKEMKPTGEAVSQGHQNVNNNMTATDLHLQTGDPVGGSNTSGATTFMDATRNTEDESDSDNRVALIRAASRGQSVSVKLLIGNSYDLKIRNMHGDTAQMMVAVTSHSECVKLLINNHCNFCNEKGDTVPI